MLYSHVKILSLFLIFFAINAIASSDVTLKYTPKALLPLSAVTAHNKKQRKQIENQMTAAQLQGLKESEQAAKWMKHPKYLKQMMKPAAEVAKHSKKIINQTIRMYRPGFMQKHGRLYYFISFSMQDSLIKAYLLDAIWNGGTLVLRGIDKGMNLHQFVFKRLMPLVQYKGAHASIEIDPNLFEEYNVKVVPTIVYTVAPQGLGCRASIASGICAPINPNEYWKISGSVSSVYALEQFKENGASVQKFIVRMQQSDLTSDKKQEKFTGDWSSAPLPDTSFDNILNKYGLSQTKTGAIGATDLIRNLQE